MGKIAVLDDNMVNMIAAGEVIERPASVVKELLENSIDAGAQRIAIEVEDGGRRLIRIIDDGGGMDADDLALAFEPHATSKLRRMDDLSGIRTMGFRGEALASIGSVAKVTVTSRTPDAIGAHRIEIDCGQRSEIVPCSGDVGTTIEVRNLFYKLPPRRKFLRTANTEMGHITEHFTRIALAQEALDLTLTHNDRQVHRLLGGQGVRERINVLFGAAVAEDLLETSRQERGMRLRTLLGRPTGARSSGKYQYVFLNRRFIRDRFILHAVKEAYRGLMEPNKFPVVFVFIEMPSEDFDVNVHPTKVEVRFDNPNLVYSEVLAVLRDKLLGTNLDVGFSATPPEVFVPSEHFADVKTGDRQHRIERAMEDFFKTAQPAAPQRSFNFHGGHSAKRPLSPPHTAFGQTQPPSDMDTDNLSDKAAWNPKTYLQVDNSYLVVPGEDGFVVIDQHALHERILYEQMCVRLRDGRLPSQRLLMPHTFEATAVQIEALEKQRALVEKIGIEIEPFGPNTLAVQAFPQMLERAEPTAFVIDLLDKLAEDDGHSSEERLLHEILDMAACKAAIKAGQALSDAEIAHLLDSKDVVQRSSRCPHGRPTTLVFSRKELEKQFKRTGF
ncbi:MAG: DNA mismatch repair endonuclease MutL [Phycisphaerae bacterium]|nr:DNA mismatch repair endonuclease MutL [Phycisphaerae bacterium]